MTLHTIENDFLRLAVSPNGAEARHLCTVDDNREWLWQADPEFWPRTAPVLFPVVGKLAENQFFHHGHPYPLSQHGFARDRVFEIRSTYPETLDCFLRSDYETWKFYPFDFELSIRYQLEDNLLKIRYQVRNCSDQMLPFSIGAHPGFALPDFPEKKWFLEFEKDESLNPQLLENGLLKPEKGNAIPLNQKRLPLDLHLFDQDALVFEKLQSGWVGLGQEGGPVLLKVHATGFPWYGIWSKPGAPFVCLEPWYGHADPPGPSAEILQKPGIILLKPKEMFECHYAIEIIR
jgi:galactose mutarotase-like enzyme